MNFTIVLLPGLNGTKGLFQPLIDSLPCGVDVLPIEFPTHDKYSYEQLCSLVIDKVKRLKGKYILLGESFSGPLSLFVSDPAK